MIDMAARHGTGGSNRERRGRAATTIRGDVPQMAFGRGQEGAILHGCLLDLSSPDLRIRLVDRDGVSIQSFGPFADEDVIAIWRGLARSTGLVPMMRAGGEPETLVRRLGALDVRAPNERRRRPPGGRRRPRFLVRRKCARLPRRPLVYRECEIASGAAG